MSAAYERVGKRVLDVVVAVPALVVLSPVLAVVAFAIWLHDRGPAVFRMERSGANDVPFVIMKFRSMPVSTPNVESAKAATLQVTPVGRFIRRTSLDELELRRANGAIRLKPGLTGLNQLNGYDEMPAVVRR